MQQRCYADYAMVDRRFRHSKIIRDCPEKTLQSSGGSVFFSKIMLVPHGQGERDEVNFVRMS